jgi:hypothetical protein
MICYKVNGHGKVNLNEEPEPTVNTDESQWDKDWKIVSGQIEHLLGRTSVRDSSEKRVTQETDTAKTSVRKGLHSLP